MRILFTLLLLLAAGSVAASPDTLPPPVIPQCVGVNIHFVGQPQRDLDGLESAGFGWIRMDFAWGSIEKTKGVYDFTEYDSLLAGLTARHIRPLFILDYGNPLYEADSPSTPDARAAFARFAAASATHFKGKPILWEIWNEPNGGFWQPKPDVAAYGALALAAAHAIHAADPQATVIAPGSSGIPLDFLESLFKQGLLKEIDAVSLHPYRGNAPETAAADYQAVRALIHKYAPPGKDVPLVSSEWGYTTVNVSETQQAQYLAREWLSNLACGIRLSIWYDWHDDGTDPKNGEHNFGTVNYDYTPKPAYLAARTLIHALAGFRFVKRVPLASPDDYLLLFAEPGGQVKMAAWTTSADHPILLPIARVTALTDLTGATVAPEMENGMLRLSLSQSPVYVQVSGDAALRQAVSWTAVPEDPFYTQGEPLKITLTYHNSDVKAHQVQFAGLLTAPDGERTAVPDGTDIVAPGQTLNVAAVSAALSRVAVQARVGLRVDGVLQPYPQDIVFIPTDPVSLSEAPVTAGRVEVDIQNPSGEAFHGVLGASDGRVSHSAPVRLMAGQDALAVTLEMPSGARCDLKDAEGRTVATLPLQTFVPYPLPVDALQPTLDGDLKVASTAVCKRVGAAEEVTYSFAPGWSFWRESEQTPAALEGEPLAYGVWVNGDSSGNQINIRYQDATGQTFQVGGPRLSWSGWKFLSFSLQTPGSGGYWGGANDGHLHYPIHLNTLLLVDSVAGAARHAGTVSWKEPTVIYAR